LKERFVPRSDPPERGDADQVKIATAADNEGHLRFWAKKIRREDLNVNQRRASVGNLVTNSIEDQKSLMAQSLHCLPGFIKNVLNSSRELHHGRGTRMSKCRA